MELVIEPDTYAPSIGDQGQYVDYIPPFNSLRKGLTCPCSTRKGQLYETRCVFATHVKTKGHQKWLVNLNDNRANYYVENEKLKETLLNQRLIIARFEKELALKGKTIDLLTVQLSARATVDDLLDFDE